jgi:hypothetical protein
MKTRQLARAEQRGFGQAKAPVTVLGAQPAKTVDAGQDRTYPGSCIGCCGMATSFVTISREAFQPGRNSVVDSISETFGGRGHDLIG